MTFLIRKMSHHKKGGQKSLRQAKVEALCLVKSFYNRWFSESQPKSVINSDLGQAKTELLWLMRHKSYWGRLVLTSDCCNGCYVLRWIQHFIRNSPHSLSSVGVIKCPFFEFPLRIITNAFIRVPLTLSNVNFCAGSLSITYILYGICVSRAEKRLIRKHGSAKRKIGPNAHLFQWL